VEGLSTQLDVLDARLALQQASTNRALTARDLQVARLRLAVLPYLPVATLDVGVTVPLDIAAPRTPTIPREPNPAPPIVRGVAAGSPGSGG
jgi:outer membrane protein TolC